MTRNVDATPPEVLVRLVKGQKMKYHPPASSLAQPSLTLHLPAPPLRRSSLGGQQASPPVSPGAGGSPGLAAAAGPGASAVELQPAEVAVVPAPELEAPAPAAAPPQPAPAGNGSVAAPALADQAERELADRPAYVPPRGKALRCSMCRERLCCYLFGIEMTVGDVGRIARALAIAPEVFLAYHQVDGPPRAFKLDRSGRLFRLVLERHPWLHQGYEGSEAAKDGARAQGEDPASEQVRSCCFLARLPSGPHVCGLGSMRPAVCHHFPVSRRDGILEVYNGPGCVRSWTLAEVDYAGELALADRFTRQAEEHERFLAEWNEYVERTLEPHENYSFNFFLDSMMNWHAQHLGEDAEGAGR